MQFYVEKYSVLWTKDHLDVPNSAPFSTAQFPHQKKKKVSKWGETQSQVVTWYAFESDAEVNMSGFRESQSTPKAHFVYYLCIHSVLGVHIIVIYAIKQI